MVAAYQNNNHLFSAARNFRTLALFLFAFLNLQLHAEIRGGVVLDANTRLPVARTSVYINGSTIGTSCNDAGVFYLRGFPQPPYRINVSAIGYETTVVEIHRTSEHHSITILLRPRTLELAETVIKAPEKDGWKIYGQEFFEEFIGYSDFARRCRISNPEVLSFFFDDDELVLRVYAEEPLIIVNNALGYRITYWLDDFKKDYKTHQLFFRGASQFEDLTTERTRRNQMRRWQNNRASAYNGSIYHFITSLYHNRTEEEGFEVRRLQRFKDGVEDESVEITYDTLYLEEFDNRKFEEFFFDEFRETRPRDTFREKYIQRWTDWYHDSMDYKVMKHNHYFARPPYRHEVTEFKKDTLNPKQILKRRYAVIFEFLFPDPINPDTLIRSSSEDKKIITFENFLHITYRNEIEDEVYRKRVAPSEPFKKVPQTSIISLREVEEISIYPNGHFEPPYGIMLEHYLSYEKLDKLLPLDFRGRTEE